MGVAGASAHFPPAFGKGERGPRVLCVRACCVCTRVRVRVRFASSVFSRALLCGDEGHPEGSRSRGALQRGQGPPPSLHFLQMKSSSSWGLCLWADIQPEAGVGAVESQDVLNPLENIRSGGGNGESGDDPHPKERGRGAPVPCPGTVLRSWRPRRRGWALERALPDTPVFARLVHTAPACLLAAPSHP